MAAPARLVSTSAPSAAASAARLAAETGNRQHRALGGLHNGLVGGGHTFLHGGGEGGGVSGLHALQGLGKAPEQQGEDDAGVAPGTPKQGGGGDGGWPAPRRRERSCAAPSAAVSMVMDILVPVSPSGHGEYVQIVDGLLLGRDSGGAVQDHLLEKRAGDLLYSFFCCPPHRIMESTHTSTVADLHAGVLIHHVAYLVHDGAADCGEC